MSASVRQGDLILGHFRVEALLGRGGMGEVWRAQDVRLQREVAIKLLLPRFADDAEYVARFERETRIVAKFKHKNIPRVYEGGQLPGGRLYMVMEVLEGRSLGRILATTKRLDVVTASFCAYQILEALQEAHTQGIVHRDIKPDNVMVSDDGHVWVCDFGVAKGRDVTRDPRRPQGHAPQQSNPIGTPRFMSPEQVYGNAVDHRSDLYSVGVLLYLILAGQYPYPGIADDDETRVLAAHALVRPEPLPKLVPDFPEELWQVVSKLLAKDPAKRHASAGDASLELSSFVRGSVPPDHAIAQKLVAERRTAATRAHFEKKRRPEPEAEARAMTAPARPEAEGDPGTAPLGRDFTPSSPCAPSAHVVVAAPTPQSARSVSSTSPAWVPRSASKGTPSLRGRARRQVLAAVAVGVVAVAVAAGSGALLRERMARSSAASATSATASPSEAERAVDAGSPVAEPPTAGSTTTAVDMAAPSATASATRARSSGTPHLATSERPTRSRPATAPATIVSATPTATASVAPAPTPKPAPGRMFGVEQ